MSAPGSLATPASATSAAGARWQRWLAIAGVLLLLFGYNRAVLDKERVLADGVVVRLRLAPLDPRALLTGDYMALRYELARAVPSGDERADGRIVVTLDDNRVASLARVIGTDGAVAANEVALRFRRRNGTVHLGTNAWYFEEGTGKRFEPARYGEFRVDARGEMLLVRMLDEKLNPL